MGVMHDANLIGLERGLISIRARSAIDQKWIAGYGQPLTDYTRQNDAVYRIYEHAVIALRREAVVSYGAIFEHWRDTGSVATWGLPLRDEEGAPNGGRASHFDGCSIWWHPKHGAWEVHGAIRDLWTAMGGPVSVAGYPLSDEVGAELGTGAQRVSHFERGDILWHGNWGALFVPKAIRLWLTGFFCVDQSNEWSASDEPYMTFGVVIPGDPQTRQVETGVIEGVKGGNKITQAHLLYEGPVRELVLACAIKEHDEGDPHAFSGTFQQVLKGAADAGVAALAGPEAVPVANSVIAPVADFLSDKLSEVMGSEDDSVGSRSQSFSIVELARLAGSPGSGDPIKDITWRIGSDEEGVYDIWFNIEPA